MSLPVDADPGEPVARRLSATSRSGRLRSEARDDLRLAIVVIDVPGVQGIAFDALSEFIALVALAPADPGADLEAYDTVLNLFRAQAGGRPAAGLTALDRAYLRALYDAAPDHALAVQQHREIVGRMEAGLGAAADWR